MTKCLALDNDPVQTLWEMDKIYDYYELTSEMFFQLNQHDPEPGKGDPDLQDVFRPVQPALA